MPHSRDARPGRLDGIAQALDVLRCPVCGEPFDVVGGSLRCGAAHSFDVARQGYVSLLDGRSGALRADTADMVAARDRVHSAGVFDPVVDAAAQVGAVAIVGAHPGRRPLVLDAGAGGGHYLRAVLREAADRGADARGLGIDLSRQCARALVRGEPAVTAVTADIWRGLPVADDCVAVLLSIFSPRNAAEFARVLSPDGRLIVVRPLPGHLGEIIAPMHMLSVDDAKTARVHAALDDHVEVLVENELTYSVRIPAPVVADLAGMGPSAFHLDAGQIDALAHALAGDGVVEVTVSVAITVCGRSA